MILFKEKKCQNILDEELLLPSILASIPILVDILATFSQHKNGMRTIYVCELNKV